MNNITILSLGGGVQSTVLALMACRGELDPVPDHIIFSDPMNESKGTYKHMEWLVSEMESAGLDYRRVTGGDIYSDVMKAVHNDDVKIGDYGQPPFSIVYGGGTKIINPGFTDGDLSMGRMWRRCTSLYKIKPIEQELRKILGLKKGAHYPADLKVIKMLGISLDEVQRMKPSRNKWEQNMYPLIDLGMTRWDCYGWLETNGYAIPPKSACIICPFHSNQHWRETRDNNPEEFEAACVLDDNLRIGQVPGVPGDVYIHRDCVPLRDIDFDNDIDRGQSELFKAECEGYCGT